MAVLVQVVGEVFAGAVALVLLVGAALVVRLRTLTRRRGTFDCALRVVPLGAADGVGAPDGPWELGVARTGSDGVRWWRSRSLSPRPRWTAPRATVEVERLSGGRGGGHAAGGRDVRGASRDGGAAGTRESPVVLVRCWARGTCVDLAMSDDAYTGFAAWLESLPPRDRGAVS